jgi:uncharacterized protein
MPVGRDEVTTMRATAVIGLDPMSIAVWPPPSLMAVVPSHEQLNVERQPGPDVIRAIALLGVFAMNYHGYLNSPYFTESPNWAERLFDPYQGVLTTRFAATFVMVAGIGISLMTKRSRASGDRAVVSVDRWVMRRRGLLLLSGGYVLNWIWNGTILFFYGALFIVASFMFTWKRRWLLTAGLASALVATAIAWWALERTIDGRQYPEWLFVSTPLSPRGLLFDIFVNGTHPLFPWLCFLCIGMVLGRVSLTNAAVWWRTLGIGAALLAVGYGASTALSRIAEDSYTDNAQRMVWFAHTDPFSRTLLYTMTAAGSSIIAVALIDALARRFASFIVIRMLSSAGRMTLTLYVTHVFVFNEVVNQRHWIRPTGLDTALVFAGSMWVALVVIAFAWQRFLGAGPLERVYRNFGGHR